MKNEILEALTIIEEEHNRTKRDIEILEQAKQEIERLHSIIKEVREYIEELQTNSEIATYDILDYEKNDILEILDKENIE